MSRARGQVGAALLLPPLVLALAGPLVAGSIAPTSAPLLPPGPGHPLGTDTLGRDALALVLRGGSSVVGMAVGALAVAYTVGVPLGLTAAAGRRAVDETVMRTLDVLLALPALLVLMVLVGAGHRGPGTLVLVTALLQLPAVTRIVRSAALAPGCRLAVEALRMQGEPWWRIQVGYVARTIVGPVVTDLGARLGLVLYLLASVNYLGLGLPAAAPDWAVLIERNSDALFSQPLVILVPATLLMALCAGTNLIADWLLARRREERVCS